MSSAALYSNSRGTLLYENPVIESYARGCRRVLVDDSAWAHREEGCGGLLLEHRFSWVLPGHGCRYAAASPEAMREELSRLISTLES